VSGNGYYEVSATDGTNGANSPYAQTKVWTTHPNSGSVIKTRMGNLGGIMSAQWGDLSGKYGFYGTGDIYIENAHIHGALTFSNQGSISISGFNNDAGYITSGAVGNKTFYQYGAPTVSGDGLKVGDFWFDTSGGSYLMKRCATITPSVTWASVSVYMDGSGVYAGSITAGQVTAGTFTGFTFQTAASGKRTLISSSDNEMHFYEASGNVVSIGSNVWGSTSGITINDGTLYAHNTSISTAPIIAITDYGNASAILATSAGYGSSNTGVQGTARNSTTNYAFYAISDSGTNNYSFYGSAGNIYNNGNVDITGTYKKNGSALTYSDVGAAASGHNHSGVYANVGANTFSGMQDMDGGFALTGMTGTASSGNLSVQDKDVVEITTTSGTLAVTLINMVDGQIVWIVNKGASYSCTCAGVTINAGKSALAKYSSSGSVWRVFTN
jgi:hypothetical protein